MTALLLLHAPARQQCCPPPCRTAAPSPGRARAFEGHSAQLLLHPPPPRLEPADTIAPPPPPQAPWNAPRGGMRGPVLIAQGLHRAPWLPCSFAPHPLSPFLWGGGREKLPWLSRHGPWGAGQVLLHLCCGGLRLRPLRAAPRGIGVGVDRCPLLLPPPPPWGGVRGPPLGGGGGQCPHLWLMTPPAPPSAGGRSPRKYPPALRRGGGGRGCTPPTRVCPRVTPVLRVPPLARRFPLGGAGRVGRGA